MGALDFLLGLFSAVCTFFYIVCIIFAIAKIKMEAKGMCLMTYAFI